MDTAAVARIGLRLLGIYYIVRGATYLLHFIQYSPTSEMDASIWLGSGVTLVGGSIITIKAGSFARRVARSRPTLGPESLGIVGLVLVGVVFVFRAAVDLADLSGPSNLFGRGLTLPFVARQLLPVLVQGALGASLAYWARPLASRFFSRDEMQVERGTMDTAIAAGIGLRLLGVYFVVNGTANLADIPNHMDWPRWFLVSGMFRHLILILAGALLVTAARLLAGRVLADDPNVDMHELLAMVGFILIGSWFLVIASAELIGLIPEMRPSLFAGPDDALFPNPDRRWIADQLLPVLVRGALGIVMIARARLLTLRLLRNNSHSEPLEI